MLVSFSGTDFSITWPTRCCTLLSTFLSLTSMILAVVLPVVSTVEDGAGAAHERNLFSLLGFHNSDEPVSTSVVSGDPFSAFVTGLTSFSGTHTAQSATSTFAAESLRTSDTPATMSNTSLSEAAFPFQTTTLPTIYAAGEASNHTNKTWQIFGVAIIAVLFVVACITSAMFFDHIWRFLREVACCKTHHEDLEEFIPDWDKQSWKTETSSPSTKQTGISAHVNDNLFATADRFEHKARFRALPWDTENLRRTPLYRQPTQTSSHTISD
ncbi:hypothetical protein F5I97DRAFT_1877284 [Phlebopus sp. FC_14]|nr:hypothetical protein F5I97DRAFT_1877284 [Phlebopus sp. FC_14]